MAASAVEPVGRRARFEVAAGFVASLAGPSFAAGAAVEVLVAPRAVNLGVRLAVHATDVREEVLGPGRARWTRAALSVGPVYRFRPGPFAIDLHAEVLAALLAIEGTGFDTSASAFDFDPGLGAGARAALRLGPATPFIGVSLAGWLRKQQGLITGGNETAEIPRFEVLLSAGVGLGNFF